MESDIVRYGNILYGIISIHLYIGGYMLVSVNQTEIGGILLVIAIGIAFLYPIERLESKAGAI